MGWSGGMQRRDSHTTELCVLNSSCVIVAVYRVVDWQNLYRTHTMSCVFAHSTHTAPGAPVQPPHSPPSP
jgi:hypothetical protein